MWGSEGRDKDNGKSIASKCEGESKGEEKEKFEYRFVNLDTSTKAAQIKEILSALTQARERRVPLNACVTTSRLSAPVLRLCLSLIVQRQVSIQLRVNVTLTPTHSLQRKNRNNNWIS